MDKGGMEEGKRWKGRGMKEKRGFLQERTIK
jgi:hypothetical protein